CPITIGGSRRPVLPSNPCTSLPQMPHARMRISNSSSADRGTSISTTSSFLYSERISAFMHSLHSHQRIYAQKVRPSVCHRRARPNPLADWPLVMQPRVKSLHHQPL